MNTFAQLRLSEEEIERFETIKHDYVSKYGKQTIMSVIRLLINDKYRDIIDNK